MTREEEFENFVKHEYNFVNGDIDYIAGIRKGKTWADEHPKSPWKDVKKELPKACKKYNNNDALKGKSKYVLTISADGDLVVARYDTINKRWCNFKTYLTTPIVWMPIPEFPKGGEG